jgi:hypothetical protein
MVQQLMHPPHIPGAKRAGIGSVFFRSPSSNNPLQ